MGEEKSVRASDWTRNRESAPGGEGMRPYRRREDEVGRAGSASRDLDPELLAVIVRVVRDEIEREPPLPRLLTLSEVIEALRTSRSAFHRLRTGQVPGARPFPKPRYVGTHPRWIADEVEAWVVESTTRPG